MTADNEESASGCREAARYRPDKNGGCHNGEGNVGNRASKEESGTCNGAGTERGDVLGNAETTLGNPLERSDGHHIKDR